MTLKELHGETCALAFDDFLALDDRFLSSAYRAMRAVYNSRKITAEKKFYVRGCLPKTKISEIRHKGGRAESLPLSGKAFSMRLYGKGNIVVSGPNGEFMKDFDCNGDYYKDFLDADTTITFVGLSSYTVCDLVTFEEVFSSNRSDIPDGDGFTVIDLREALPDFLSLDSMPTDASGKTLTAAVVYDGKIKLPDSYSGEISIVYRKRPMQPSLYSPESRIDIPAEYEPLLPLYCAYYLLLEDEPEKAEFYREEYEKMLAVIGRGFVYSFENKYLDTNGWA
ncbi:MAG: hypothetical protein E7676_01570 [Ruminococcaceae bacterium]|nr:hypothetical protein [Oscillospiraceae bacterium]